MSNRIWILTNQHCLTDGRQEVVARLIAAASKTELDYKAAPSTFFFFLYVTLG